MSESTPTISPANGEIGERARRGIRRERQTRQGRKSACFDRRPFVREEPQALAPTNRGQKVKYRLFFESAVFFVSF
jgi:hypothetical protein